MRAVAGDLLIAFVGLCHGGRVKTIDAGTNQRNSGSFGQVSQEEKSSNGPLPALAMMLIAYNPAAAYSPPAAAGRVMTGLPEGPSFRVPSPAMFDNYFAKTNTRPNVVKNTKPLSPVSRGANKNTRPIVGGNAKPLSPGSNYPATKNIQTQSNGFGTFVQGFQLSKGKSKYGVPVFLANGNVNPAYLAAERKELAQKKLLNRKATETKRKGLISSKQFELADYIRKKIGEVGSGKEYYMSGK